MLCAGCYVLDVLRVRADVLVPRATCHVPYVPRATCCRAACSLFLGGALGQLWGAFRDQLTEGLAVFPPETEDEHVARGPQHVSTRSTSST